MNAGDNLHSSLPAPWNAVFPLALRIFVWGMLFLIVYILRAFFLLMFLTFVFAYIQGRGVDRLRAWMPGRTSRVVSVSLIFLALLVAIGNFLIPRVRDQAERFAANYTVYLSKVDLELVRLAERYPVMYDLYPDFRTYHSEPDGHLDLSKSPTALLIKEMFGKEEHSTDDTNLRYTVGALKNVGSKLLAIGSAFLLALLFSFLILLDLPKIAHAVAGLKETRVGFVYDEVAGSIFNFAHVVGRSLEAQFFIALINTCLTAIGVYLLGLNEHIAFLSMIVFLCGFIPVAGVFISSAPICLLALQYSGVGTALLAALMIWIIHMIEAYILNPKIYGYHLRLNPVAVLIILTIGGKLFGVWGLVLGLPVCTYIFGHAIRFAGQSRFVS